MVASTLLSTGNGTRVLPPPTELIIEGASAFEAIPIIDLAQENRTLLVEKIREACLKVGFLYIKNHGIPQSTINATLNEAHRFFDLPLTSKQALDIHLSPAFKGYTALLGENSDPANRGDLHEGFDVGSESEQGEMRGNVWPPETELPGFKEKVMEYYDAVLSLGRRLFPLFALSLSLPEDFFDDKILHPAAIMRLLHYPSQTGPTDDRILGIGAHTDYECFTLLYQDIVPALQVLNAAGKWVSAPPIEGTFVCNLGDQFARWTNDVYVSTVHRAINRTGQERYSIPFFFGTDYDVKLEALPSCVSEDRPARYEVVTAGEYVKSRLEETYAQSK
ncbi:Clavaminate synthase-like protein [Dacryopinax primogenitus]|uniref:Clavaminate synthase-like protein n=1 Tax=Dacryopinax primogenitus (strain DJM 731) TaxID=1858805 RepID=M5GE68_DACPD|nr:Clavaminate synthase-like protein [Dacryopinax primogenitus]EJU03023.1 Clavaminate synthase-like protein [Dacryopinax primogenitus]